MATEQFGTRKSNVCVVPWEYGETVEEVMARVPVHPEWFWKLDRIEEDLTAEHDRWLLRFEPGARRD